MRKSRGKPRATSGARGKRRTGAPRGRTSGHGRPPSIEDLADVIVRGGAELLDVDDPLEAEAWASAMLGQFYKIDAPWEARDELERTLWPTVVGRAEAAHDASSLAVLEALGAVADEDVARAARGAAGRLRAAGIPSRGWAGELGKVAFEDAWMLADVYGDHEAYVATFRYPGRPSHVVNALYDKAMGEIIKDGFVGYTKGDLRRDVPTEPGVATTDADPKRMARRIIDAIASGDLYLDNDWTPEFKRYRALILARMQSLPAPRMREARPPGSRERQRLIREFLASDHIASGGDAPDADLIASHCLDYSCDYLGDDGLRWSPIVVEQFMLDYLPRKVSMSLAEVRQVPTVLRGWVRFALARRGLEERWIAETQSAVDANAKAFRSAMTNVDEFGLAKRLGASMLADGVAPLDQASVDRWIEDFNARPLAERDALLGRPRRPGDGPGV